LKYVVGYTVKELNELIARHQQEIVESKI
jgi:hypothetical protein